MSTIKGQFKIELSLIQPGSVYVCCKVGPQILELDVRLTDKKNYLNRFVVELRLAPITLVLKRNSIWKPKFVSNKYVGAKYVSVWKNMNNQWYTQLFEFGCGFFC